METAPSAPKLAPSTKVPAKPLIIKTPADLDAAITDLVPIIRERLGMTTTASHEFLRFILRDAKLFDNKQHDYGSKNISTFGAFGVIVRMNDKWERMRNLFGKNKKAKVKESISDTMADLTNYSVIYRMLDAGKWTEE